MKYIFFLFPIFLQAQCLIETHSYRLVCADEVRYADSTSIGSRLYISSRNAFVTSPRSVFSLVNGYGQHFIQITNAANSQKVAINRAWINRIDSTSSNKALIYIKDISVTFTSVESYTAVKDSAIACFVRSVASGLATLSDGDYGDVVVSGGGLVMTVDKPDLGLHNLADGDFSVAGDSTALSLTNVRRISLLSKTIDGWLSRYLQDNNQITLRTQSSSKVSRIFIDTTGANFQFINGSNNASLRFGDSVAVRFNTSGSVGDVLTVTSVDGDGRLVINPKTGGSGTANCEQTLTKASHGFRKWTPIYWNGSVWARPTFDSIIPTYIVVDSTSANTFKVSNCGNYSSTLTAGLYYYTGTSPGYTLTQPTIKTPLFEVAQSRLILQPLVGFQLASGATEGISSSVLADTAAAIRDDFPSGGVSDGDKGDITVSSSGATWTIDNSAITSAKIASQTVDSLDIKNGVITTVKIADDAVTTGKILNSTILNADLSSQTLDSSKMGNRAITLLKLAVSGATNGQVPIYNSTTGIWAAGTLTGSQWTTTGSDIYYNTGRVGFQVTSPTAIAHLKAGTATANTAPLKFNSGTNLTTAEAGAIEYDGTEFYATNSTASRTTIIRGLKGSATLDFPNTGPIGAADLTITVTGAALGDVVGLGIPNGSTNGTSNYHAWVSAADTVKIRMFNANAGAAFDPASGTFSIIVYK